MMDLAWLSLAALLVVIVASCTIRLNPGFLSIVLAWIIGMYLAPLFGKSISFRELVGGFPVDLFLTLVGVTLLFTQAHVNGTLGRVTHQAVRLCRGNVGMMPILFFFLTLVLATIGAGNIAASALVAPMAMATAQQARVPPFLMAIMVAHGAIGGALSPFAPTGIIANNLLRDRLAITGYEWPIYLDNLLANALVAFAGYFLFGGWRLFRRRYPETADAPAGDIPTGAVQAAGAGQKPANPVAAEPFEPRHWVTLGVIVLLIVAVIGFDVHVGMAAFTGAVVLTLLGTADENKVVGRLPWGVIMMVCGVTVLTSLLEKTGGTDRLIQLISHVSTPQTVTAVVALITGVVSVYSSTSGVVLPAFLPLVPGLVRAIPGSDALAIASAMIVGGHLVDSSPLSTIGALCVASAPPTEDRGLLFNQTLAWGLSMAVVGAAGCYLFF
jgi:di/tricarboxylate transporter